MLIFPPVIRGILLGLGTGLVLMFNWVVATFPTTGCYSPPMWSGKKPNELVREGGKRTRLAQGSVGHRDIDTVYSRETAFSFCFSTFSISRVSFSCQQYKRNPMRGFKQ